MNLPRRIASWSTALVLGAACCSCTTFRETGWRPIFDGHSTDGWKMTGPGELKLENGELVTHGGMGMLWYSPEKFGDCEIRVRFKMSAADDNSGVFVRIPEPPADPWYAVHHGYEVQICNIGDERHRTGCLYSFSKAVNAVDAPVGEWSEMIVRLEGPHTVVKVNGKVVTDWTEGDAAPPKTKDYEPERGLRPNAGYIGLQNHGEPARVHFKQVSVRLLAKKS